MKKIITVIKNFKFKIFLTVGLTVIFYLLNYIFDTDIFNTPFMVLLGGLFVFVLVGFWLGVYNTWVVDKDKVGASTFGLIGGAMLSFVIYLIFFS